MFSQLWKGRQNSLRHIFILAKKNKTNKLYQFSSVCFFSDDVAFQIYTL